MSIEYNDECEVASRNSCTASISLSAEAVVAASATSIAGAERDVSGQPSLLEYRDQLAIRLDDFKGLSTSRDYCSTTEQDGIPVGEKEIETFRGME